MPHDTILVLDFGSQYTQLITRVIREQSVYSVQLPWQADQRQVREVHPKGIILSGGPSSIYSPGAPRLPDFLLDLEIPLLGICYGMQALAEKLGGKVHAAPSREYGKALLSVADQNPLLPPGQHQVWMSHGDYLEKVPDDFLILGRTDNTPAAAMGNLERGIYGVQFHPEVKHTPIGTDLIRNFLFNVCGVKATWTADSIVDQTLTNIQRQAGSARIIAAVSGGVDSTVAAAIVHKAVGDQLDAVFVDTGLLRLDEGEKVVNALRNTLGIRLHVIDAADQFFQDLKGITDPEQKRAIIGNRFIRIFEHKARTLGEAQYLVQGTIYPDVVESTAPERKETETIKTHHNVGGLPSDMEFQLIEPLRYLFKDEVRKIGEAIGLPAEMVWRQPFPGPGLAIRCLGEVRPERISLLRAADAIFLQELAEAGLLASPSGTQSSDSSQAFAVLLPVKSVGVMGDQRTYQHVIALRSVSTLDFMTADWSRLPQELLARISNRIVNEVPGINRVVYDITSKPPGTIEWE